MFHSITELLMDYWRARRGGRPFPRRSDIEPSGFSQLASRVFLVQRLRGDVIFRIVGEEINELHGAQLKGQSLLGLWRAHHRPLLAIALDAALRGATPIVVVATAGEVRADAPQLELLFAPLLGPGGGADRFLGCCQPLDPAIAKPIGALSIARLDGVRLPAPVRPRLATLDGRRIA